MNNNKNTFWLGTGVLVLASLVGCVAKERTVTREVSESGRGWAQTQLTQEYRGPGGLKVKDKQIVQERVQCISKKTGAIIPVDSEEACLKKGGKIIDEIITDEYTSVKKR